MKWIGLTSGFMNTHSALGAIAGFVIGSIIDYMFDDSNKSKAKKQEYSEFRDEPEASEHTEEDTRDRFLFSLLVLAAHVIQADGRIMHSEMEWVRGWLRTNFGEESVEQGNNILLKIFEYCKLRGESAWQDQIRQACGEMVGFMPMEHRIQLVAMLAEIARADGRIDPTEIMSIKQIALQLGLSPDTINSLLALGGESIDEAYQVLGIAPTASDEEVKAAYRRMVKLNHPDRVASLGEDVRAAANRKMQEINKAKDLIYKQRGL